MNPALQRVSPLVGYTERLNEQLTERTDEFKNPKSPLVRSDVRGPLGLFADRRLHFHAPSGV